VLERIRDDVPLSAAAAGVLTTAPVICMSLGAPFAPRLARRAGHEGALALLALCMGVGILLRLVPGVVPLYAGTVVAGIGIAGGNVLVPALVKRDFPGRVGAMTGAFTMAVTGSAALAAALTVPALEVFDEGWRPALAVWALPALAAAAAWLPMLRSGAARAANAAVRPSPRLWRNRLAWKITVYMGLQSFSFYTWLTWLPALLGSEGMDDAEAGLMLSVMTLISIPVGLLVPMVARHRRDQRAVTAGTIALAAGGTVGLLAAPTAATVVWVAAIGVAQGAMLALSYLFFVLRTPDEEHAAQLSSMAQTVGYLVAAVGPVAVGALHDVTDAWTLPVVLLLAVLAGNLLAGLGAARDRQVADS
jgi:MFS transporter, CP family, cyanate transporter